MPSYQMKAIQIAEIAERIKSPSITKVCKKLKKAVDNNASYDDIGLLALKLAELVNENDSDRNLNKEYIISIVSANF